MSIKSVITCLCAIYFTNGLVKGWAPYPLFENTIYDYTQPEYLFSKNRHTLNLGNPEDFRNAVFEVCRYTFAGAWNLITAKQMRFYELRRSLNDRWYYCGLPFDLKPLYREYGEAAVIFYGPGRRHPENTNKVSMVHAYFSQKQAQQHSTLLTPRILGSFPGGRVEEYWQNTRVAQNADVPFIAKEVLKKMAYIHGLNPPAPRSIDHFWHEISTFISIIRRAQFNHKADKHLPKQRTILAQVLQTNLEAEALWLRHYLNAMSAPIVFSLGNPRVDQIYLRQYGKPENKLTFLNLGWGQYLYRSYDMADFILEAAIEFNAQLPYPHFKVSPDFTPTPQQLNDLISSYLQSMTQMEREWPSTVNTVEAMLEELERTTLLSHYYNAVQALLSSFYNFGKVFGFPEYSKTRLDMYYTFKKEIIEKKGLKIPLFATNINPNDLIDKGYPGARLIGPNDRLYLDPFSISSDSISGYMFPLNYVTNLLDLNLCQKLSQNNQQLTNAVNEPFLNTHPYVTNSVHLFHSPPAIPTNTLPPYIISPGSIGYFSPGYPNKQSFNNLYEENQADQRVQIDQNSQLNRNRNFVGPANQGTNLNFGASNIQTNVENKLDNVQNSLARSHFGVSNFGPISRDNNVNGLSQLNNGNKIQGPYLRTDKFAQFNQGQQFSHADQTNSLRSSPHLEVSYHGNNAFASKYHGNNLIEQRGNTAMNQGQQITPAQNNMTLNSANIDQFHHSNQILNNFHKVQQSGLSFLEANRFNSINQGQIFGQPDLFNKQNHDQASVTASPSYGNTGQTYILNNAQHSEGLYQLGNRFREHELAQNLAKENFVTSPHFNRNQPQQVFTSLSQTNLLKHPDHAANFGHLTGQTNILNQNQNAQVNSFIANNKFVQSNAGQNLNAQTNAANGVNKLHHSTSDSNLQRNKLNQVNQAPNFGSHHTIDINEGLPLNKNFDLGQQNVALNSAQNNHYSQLHQAQEEHFKNINQLRQVPLAFGSENIDQLGNSQNIAGANLQMNAANQFIHAQRIGQSVGQNFQTPNIGQNVINLNNVQHHAQLEAGDRGADKLVHHHNLNLSPIGGHNINIQAPFSGGSYHQSNRFGQQGHNFLGQHSSLENGAKFLSRAQFTPAQKIGSSVIQQAQNNIELNKYTNAGQNYAQFAHFNQGQHVPSPNYAQNLVENLAGSVKQGNQFNNNLLGLHPNPHQYMNHNLAGLNEQTNSINNLNNVQNIAGQYFQSNIANLANYLTGSNLESQVQQTQQGNLYNILNRIRNSITGPYVGAYPGQNTPPIVNSNTAFNLNQRQLSVQPYQLNQAHQFGHNLGQSNGQITNVVNTFNPSQNSVDRSFVGQNLAQTLKESLNLNERPKSVNLYSNSNGYNELIPTLNTAHKVNSLYRSPDFKNVGSFYGSNNFEKTNQGQINEHLSIHGNTVENANQVHPISHSFELNRAQPNSKYMGLNQLNQAHTMNQQIVGIHNGYDNKYEQLQHGQTQNQMFNNINQGQQLVGPNAVPRGFNQNFNQHLHSSEGLNERTTNLAHLSQSPNLIVQNFLPITGSNIIQGQSQQGGSAIEAVKLRHGQVLSEPYTIANRFSQQNGPSNFAHQDFRSNNLNHIQSLAPGSNIGHTNLVQSNTKQHHPNSNLQASPFNFHQNNHAIVGSNVLNQVQQFDRSFLGVNKFAQTNQAQFAGLQNVQGKIFDNPNKMQTTTIGSFFPKNNLVIPNQAQNVVNSNAFAVPLNNFEQGHNLVTIPVNIEQQAGSFSNHKRFNEYSGSNNFGQLYQGQSSKLQTNSNNNMNLLQNSASGSNILSHTQQLDRSFLRTNRFNQVNQPHVLGEQQNVQANIESANFRQINQGQNNAHSNLQANLDNRLNIINGISSEINWNKFAHINQGQNLANSNLQSNAINNINQAQQQSQDGSVGVSYNFGKQQPVPNINSFATNLGQLYLGPNQALPLRTVATQHSQPDSTNAVQSDIDQIFLDPDFDASYISVPIKKEVILADKPALEVN